MANTPIFTVGGVDYNVKDTAARNQIETVNEKIDYRDTMMDNGMPSVFTNPSISGTFYQAFDFDMPVGEYVVSAESVSTEGTGNPRVVFNYRDNTSAQCFLPVGNNTSARVRFAKPVYQVYVFAGSDTPGSTDKAFAITNFKISSIAIANIIDVVKTEVDYNTAAIKKANLFNGNIHNNIPSNVVGSYYGTETALDSYFYTDLIPIIPNKTIYVRVGVSGDAYHYVYYYTKNKQYITQEEGRTMGAHSNIPADAAYFCVSTNDTRQGQLVISYDFPAEYYEPNSINATANNSIPKQYVRYDRGQIKDWYANGEKLYPMTYGEALCSTYPMPVPKSRTLRCVTATRYIAVEYFDANLNRLSGSGEAVQYASLQLTIPANAVVVCAYAGDCDPSEYYFVEGTSDLDHVPTFDEIKMSSVAEIGSNLYGQRILFIGDSIMAGSLYNGGWSTIIRQQTGAVVTNRAHDGWTVGKLENRSDNLIDRLNETTGDYDLIVLSGGYNDLTTAPRAPIGTIDPTPYNDSSLYDPYTFAGGIETYIRLARSKWQSAKIVYVLTMRRVWQNATTTSEQLTYWNIIRTACEKWAIPYLDLSRTSDLIGDGINGANDPITHKYYHNDDGTHPNTLGYEYTCPQIMHFLERMFF